MSSKLIQENDPAFGASDANRQSEKPCPSASQEMGLHDVLEALPNAVYTTDALGRVTFYNTAAESFWGVRPALYESDCELWKLYWPDGTPLPHDQSPMATTLREKRPIRGFEAIAERLDGSRIRFLAYPSPIFNGNGELIGAVNMLVDFTSQAFADDAALTHNAIVESSDDAIVAKDLNGIIINWNRGAQHLFGYSADEAIGKPVSMLIPLDRPNEEPDILQRIGRGERIEHYETIRRRKDGSLVEISLSVSPIRNREGRIIGAAKIARDITERRQAEAQKTLLIREMDHRVKNLFALANSVVSLSARSATTTDKLASAVSLRLNALARAHALTLSHGLSNEQPTTLHTLIQTIIAPYAGGEDNAKSRASITGPDIHIAGNVVTSFALLLHEFATNAAKYGALSSVDGHVEIVCSTHEELFTIEWNERGGPLIEADPDDVGFGTLLAKATVRGQLCGEITRDWKREGLSIRLAFKTSAVCAQ